MLTMVCGRMVLGEDQKRERRKAEKVQGKRKKQMCGFVRQGLNHVVLYISFARSQVTLPEAHVELRDAAWAISTARLCRLDRECMKRLQLNDVCEYSPPRDYG